MFTARKVRANNTIDFAAEGFRLGLFEAFRIGMDHYTYETERFFDFSPAIRSLKYLIAEMK